MGMRKLILDVENTTTVLNTKYSDYSPYNPGNKLVSIGWAWLEDGKVGDIKYLFLHHNEIEKWSYFEDLHLLLEEFGNALARADVLIAQNAKYDLQWLAEAGFDISGKRVDDTMIREYVMARGRGDISFKLSDTCKRYKVAEKGELFEKYPDMQISEMPIEEVEEYGRGDIQACGELYLAQEERLNSFGYGGLRKTIDMMNEFCTVLVSIERNGVKIDEAALDKVEAEFRSEQQQLIFDLNNLVKKYMGDTPINLDSPKQLSEVIYSRRIRKGQEDNWISTFNIGKDARNKHLRRPKMSYNEYATNVKELTWPVLKTIAKQCEICLGTGKYSKIKKDGTQFSRQYKCKPCYGGGYIYVEQNEVAGFRMKPKNIAFTTINGFSTGQTFLDELILQAEEENKPEAKLFLEKLARLSSISSYLSNFVEGIRTFKQGNNVLHSNLNQCITATGRLSSTKPNMQNMPRAATFPIRKCFVSRFKYGKILDVDFCQLEFRVAVHLAKCEKGKKDILDGVDLHQQTAEIITQAGQFITRQEAKSRSFRPLYGGHSGTEAERTYNRSFLTERYPGIGEWHKKLEEEAISTKMVTTETGRQYLFPDIERAFHGGSTKGTQVKNFPVQGVATADLLPCAMICLYKEMVKLKLKSCMVLNVHDSCIIDVHPEEVDMIIKLASNLGKFAEEELYTRYGIVAFVPFNVEVKIGENAMELKKVA